MKKLNVKGNKKKAVYFNGHLEPNEETAVVKEKVTKKKITQIDDVKIPDEDRELIKEQIELNTEAVTEVADATEVTEEVTDVVIPDENKKSSKKKTTNKGNPDAEIVPSTTVNPIHTLLCVGSQRVVSKLKEK